MRIEPTPGQTPVTQSSAPTARPSTRPSEGGKASDSATFNPTAELAGLLQAVQSSPDIRTDVVDAISARLAAGEFATMEAATQTAKAALATGDLTPPSGN